jgi:CSLREA domain-containing protein
MRRPFLAILLTLAVCLSASATLGAGSAPQGKLSLTVPVGVDGQTSVALEFSLPGKVAAFDGRLLFDTAAAELVGLAPLGGGNALSPQLLADGAAIAAYGLRPSAGKTRMRIVLDAQSAGTLELTLSIDAAVDSAGRRLALGKLRASGALVVGKGGGRFGAPADRGAPKPVRPAGPVRDVVADGVIGKMDLDLVRAGWEAAHANASACGAGIDPAADANGDGCVDIADVQAVAVAQGQRTSAKLYPTSDSRSVSALPADSQASATRRTASTGDFTPPARTASLAGAGLTFVVTSTADTPDAANGDGACADSSGQCTLRAAITESNWQVGDNRIEFNLPGSAPVLIQLSSSTMSLVQDRSGGLVIDGYSQPGSSVNSAAVGSNAVPGVMIRGTGEAPRGSALRITSANNTVRGILFSNLYRAVIVDGADAAANRIVGNLFGYTAAGAPETYSSYAGVLLNAGAHHNIVGTPALADRNVATGGSKALYLYGPGTDDNVIQNNLLCMTPSGMAVAVCGLGIDNDFGPKRNLIGGSADGERNVIGPSHRQGVELSHGWDPAGVDTSEKWQVNDNRVIGNWIGFRADGIYNAAFRSSLDNPGSSDNGNAINAHDGANRNLIERNWISSAYDGIQTMSPNSSGNIIRNNIIGETPAGQPAFIGRDGIVARINTRSHLIEGNTIRNATRYGIALSQKDVLWVRVTRNVISDMVGQAIYFAPDPADPTKGADDMLPLPVISSATTVEVTGQALAGATVEVFRASRPAGQVGLPTEFLADAVADSNGNWTLPVVLATGDRVTALQILPNGNTSRLAVNVAATFEQPPNAPVASFSWTQQAGTREVAFNDTSSGSPASWSWSFGDGITSTEQSPSHVYAAPGTYNVTLTATNAGGSSSETKAVTVEDASAVVVASDTFNRTVNGGWGTADVGGAYTVFTNTSNYSVANGYGAMTLPAPGATRSALLDGVSQRNVDIRARVALDKVASGASSFVYFVARRTGNNEYRPRLVFNTNGTASVNASMLVNGAESPLGSAVVVPNLTQVPGAFVWIRAEVTGVNPTTIRVKAWADGQQEPSGWLFTATNSNAALQVAGSVGVRSYILPGVNNSPVQVRIDDYTVATTASSTAIAGDAFTRDATASWKNADLGGLYTIEGTAANYNVANGVGTINVPAAGITRSAVLNEVSAHNVDVRFKVATDKVAQGGNYIVYAVCRRQGNNEYRPRLMFNTNGTLSVSASVVVNGAESPLGAPVVVAGLTQAPNAFYWLRAQVTDASPTTVRVKAWADGQAEPANWQFTATNSATALQAAGALGMRVYIHSTVVPPVKFTFDDYSVVSTQ